MRALAAIVMSMLVATASAQEDMAIKNQEAKVYKGKVTRQVELQYLLFLPEGYKEESKEGYPLMLFLHGAGERGTNLAKVAIHGPARIVKTKKDFPFILVSPQCPPGKTWDDEALLGLLDEIEEKYNVDTNRVYLTGLSMGGYGTWSLGTRNPRRFAAIAPICGGGETLHLLLPERGNEAALKRLPIRVFHGGKDTVVPVQESERMVEAMKRIGNTNVSLTVYPEAGHNSWTETYNNPELYEWFLSQKLKAK